MKNTIILILAAVLFSCSSPIQQQPTTSSVFLATEAKQEPLATSTSYTLATLVAIGSSIEVTFDGNMCTIFDVITLAPGKRVITLTNTSGESAYLYVARNYPGYTWQDVLKDIGTPGSTDAQARNTVIMQSDYTEFANEEISYQQYTFEVEGEYNIVIQGHGEYYGIWPCGPFYVKASQ